MPVMMPTPTANRVIMTRPNGATPTSHPDSTDAANGAETTSSAASAVGLVEA
jgi:hypothetical protein